MTTIAKLKALGDRDFENLTFDLMIYSGLRNASWRTPGADGGRDIEGAWTIVDPAQQVRQELWYSECKRYKSSVSWPTVFEKVAYASNASADVLLLVTSGAVTPNCKNEIAKWNAQKRRPLIQYLDGGRLAMKVAEYPTLSTKYGLSKSKKLTGKDALGVLSALMSACDSAEGELDGKFESVGSLAAFDLARIVRRRVEELSIYGRFSSKADRDVPLPQWVSSTCGIAQVPAAVRAFTSYFRFLTRPVSIELVAKDAKPVRFRFAVSGARYTPVGPDMDEVAIWCDLVATWDGSELALEVS